MKLDIGVGPATVGLNDVTIDVLEPAQGLVALTLRFDPVDAYVESIVISVTPTLTGKGQMIVDRRAVQRRREMGDHRERRQHQGQARRVAGHDGDRRGAGQLGQRPPPTDATGAGHRYDPDGGLNSESKATGSATSSWS